MDLLFCVQIAEFGMSRDLQDENNYISHAEKIPIKWTAPEVSKLLILYSYIVDCITTGITFQAILHC